MDWEVSNATIVNSKNVKNGYSLSIQDNLISGVQKSSKSGEGGAVLDARGYLLFPGIINCHDHLLGSYWPRVGDRRPYLNWLEWDNDLKASPVYAERQQIESTDLYLLGAYRHVLCGVTSVQDHIPHFVRELFAKDLPVRLIDKYAMAHSVTSYALAWGDGIEKEHTLAVEQDIPFITHSSEGFDNETIRSVETLEKKGAISPQTVLIHGIALSDEDIAKLASAGSNVVWCPVSNLYMFGRTLPIKKLLDAGVNVVLGTDSPMSGSINIFEDIRVARNFYKDVYQENLDPKIFFDMATIRAAKAMRIDDTRGSLEEGKYADFVLVEPRHSDPYETFVQMDYADINLVVINGLPVYGDPQYSELFKGMGVKFDYVRVAGSRKIVRSGLADAIHRVRAAVKFNKKLDFLPVEPEE